METGSLLSGLDLCNLPNQRGRGVGCDHNITTHGGNARIVPDE
jgi:hypothetical protein